MSPGEELKTTPKPDVHETEVMLCIWWNTKGLVHFELLNPGQKITTQLYSQELNRAYQALRRKRMDTSKTKFLQSSARHHIAKITQHKIEELGWELLPHPPYSPDLAPSDYHLFRSMQHFLEDKKFKNSEEVKIWVSSYFDSRPASFFADGIHSVRNRWRTVIHANPEYTLD